MGDIVKTIVFGLRGNNKLATKEITFILAIEVAEERGISPSLAREWAKNGEPQRPVTPDDRKRWSEIQSAARRLGISTNGIRTRLQLGWTWEEAINLPVSHKPMVDGIGSLTDRIKEAAKKLKMTPAAIRNRIRLHGWDVDKALTVPQYTTRRGQYHYRSRNRKSINQP